MFADNGELTAPYTTVPAQAKMTGLELIGVLFCIYLLWLVGSVVFDLIYTCYLGKVLGRTLNVKKLGEWAGKFIAPGTFLIQAFPNTVLTFKPMLRHFGSSYVAPAKVTLRLSSHETFSVIVKVEELFALLPSGNVLKRETCLRLSVPLVGAARASRLTFSRERND